jgi:hypothetical protein
MALNVGLDASSDNVQEKAGEFNSTRIYSK